MLIIKLKNLSDYATECFDYFQKWNVIFSLNTKWLILKKESFLERTKNLLPEIMPLNTWMNRFIIESKDILYDYVKRMGS